MPKLHYIQCKGPEINLYLKIIGKLLGCKENIPLHTFLHPKTGVFTERAKRKLAFTPHLPFSHPHRRLLV